MLLYYIRHGHPCYDPDSLTELGLRQAEILSKREDFNDFDVIYSSTSTRAMQTAMPTAKRLNKEIIPLEWAHESRAWQAIAVKKDNGGKTWPYQHDEYMRIFASNEWKKYQKWYEHPKFDKNITEKINEYDRLTDDFMLSLGYLHNRATGTYTPTNVTHKKVAFFAHEGFGYIFLSSLLSIDYPNLVRIANNHTGVTIIEFAENSNEIIPKVLSFSDTSHLK